MSMHFSVADIAALLGTRLWLVQKQGVRGLELDLFLTPAPEDAKPTQADIVLGTLSGKERTVLVSLSKRNFGGAIVGTNTALCQRVA